MTEEELLDDLEQYALLFPDHYNILIPRNDLLKLINLARRHPE